jgi:MFS transporter, DHA1 family, multidrug resistance protein
MLDAMSLPPAAVAALPSPPRATLSAPFAALTLALLLGLQALTTDLYLPALPMLAHDLAAPMPAVQMTMAALIFSFGIAQLVWGPVADRAGRRPVLLAGLVLYALAALGAAWAGSIGQVIFWRGVQGAGMSAAVVCARAMVRDLYEPHEGAHVMSQALTGLGFIAVASPVAGGLLSSAAGWRATMVALTVFGAGLLVFVMLRVPETIRERNPAATRIAPFAAQLGRTLAHRGFQAWAALVCCSYGGLIVFLAGAPFVLMDGLGLNAWQCGLAMGTNSIAYVAGTFICRRLLPRFGLSGAVLRASGFTAVAGLTMLVVAASGVWSVWTVLVPQWIYALGHGVHQPCGQAGAVGPFPHAAGVASALAGFALAVVGFAVSTWLGWSLVAGAPAPYFLAVAAFAAASALVAATLVRRHGEPLGR